MSQRHRFLVTYDIADPKRLRKIHKTMKEFGWAMQYSVFVSDLNHMELCELRIRLADIIHHQQDSIAIINVGLPNDRGRDNFEFFGVHPDLPTTGPLVL